MVPAAARLSSLTSLPGDTSVAATEAYHVIGPSTISDAEVGQTLDDSGAASAKNRRRKSWPSRTGFLVFW